ncbi:MAG: aldo/keto reductase [Tenericutes bacterium HGW-Tenericutes-2]|jgi:diketogulonate reductase-like aldo/keto reductase|nr:MAG: aldo/keto reductase [Tenericutes bacterium HGW-Tenericutes-2]
MNKKLANGVLMPMIGLGTFLVADGTSAYETVLHALSVGYRHIDTAQMYKNEESVGQAIKDSKIPRKDIFITTKQRGHSTVEKMRAQFEESLAKLQTDYVDLYLIHWPNQDKKINQQTWAFFETLYQEKKVRAIGVSNFTRSHLTDLFETAEIKPMVNQVELHPGLSQVPLKKYLDSEGIAIESYGPLMKGGVFEGIWGETLGEIAKNHNASIPQVIFAWGMARDVIMIPKSVTPSRIEENFKSKDLVLTKEELLQIDDLNRGKRVYTDPDNSPWGPYTE